MKEELTKEELDILIQYVSFMKSYDDDPNFRKYAVSAKPKLKMMLEKLENKSVILSTE